MSELQKDLVLAPNEYAYVLDETKGNVACNVGPHKMSLSQSDKLVRFNFTSKKFQPCENYHEAITLFTSAPEGWYIALKNPAPGNKHPSPGTSNTIPENMQIGRKVNIPGPVSFALYPGQMAQSIRGHSLRSNQYLVARVYDADSLNENLSEGDIPYINGQILIIKGTEVPFYIPPTGIEVKAINDNPKNGYARDAITLERLEYCILKDEDGNKRYVHGPEVVFPSPTESFLKDGNDHIKRNAIELSDISGVYVKVIADYKDEDGIEHKTGDELFITGKDQMIYYPRPEHTFITYNGRIMHHAIAIPKGEGRYIMNRLTGEIKTVRGPAMYLPDPRIEVAIKRTLSRSQCMLWYPDNQEVLEANGYGIDNITKDITSYSTRGVPVATFADNTMYAAAVGSYSGTPTKKENNKINRSNTFTPPRTISLDSGKYEGAVAIDVWTGYAVNVISKDGTRSVIKGPQTILLDYDETLETLELSTGKPKTTDNLEKVAFLRHENNHISDIINVETSDFVSASIKVNYHINFDEALVDKWFSVDNYVKHLCDWARSAIKKVAKEFTIAEFHDSYQEILIAAITDEDATDYIHKFKENGMTIIDVEIFSLTIQSNIQDMIDKHQERIISKALELTAAKNSVETEAEIAELDRQKIELHHELKRKQLELEAETAQKDFELRVMQQVASDEENKRQHEIKKEIQDVKDAIFQAEEARKKQVREAELEHKKALAEIEAKREAEAATNMKIILEAIGPDLAASMNSQNNQATIKAIAESIAPYALAEGKSVSDAVSTLLRGTTFEQILKTMEEK